MFFMVADIRLVSSVADEPNSGWNGEVPIFDMAGFTVRHITCVVLSVLRVYMKYTQVRIKFIANTFNDTLSNANIFILFIHAGVLRKGIQCACVKFTLLIAPVT